MTPDGGDIEVVAAGPRTTVQDLGRRGSQRYGVSVSGVLDADATVLGNRLVGNDSGAAVLECTFGSVQLRFNVDAIVAVTGARSDVAISGIPQPMWTTLLVPSDSTLEVGIPTDGSHVYVAVNGGIDVPEVLGSRATHVGTKMGGKDGRALVDGDQLQLGDRGDPGGVPIPGTTAPDAFDTWYVASSDPIRVVKGAQYGVFTESGISEFWGGTFTVSAVSDRQGSRLEGGRVAATDGKHDIISEAAFFGAVQVPSDGQPIVLLADRQTTGGYAKIASVITADMPRMAQKPPGSEVKFAEVDVSMAQELSRKVRSSVFQAELRPPKEVGAVAMVCNSVEYDVAVRRAGSHGDGSLWWAKIDGGEESAVVIS